MPSTPTPGITVNGTGHRIIDKEHRGMRIYARPGLVSEEEAKQRLSLEVTRVETELLRKANARPPFADCAARYLAESQDRRSVDVTAWHVRLVIPYIGELEASRIHDGTLQSFIDARPCRSSQPWNCRAMRATRKALAWVGV